MSMKILEINKWLAPGGAERFIVDLSNELVEIEGNTVYLCTYMDESDHTQSFYKPQLSDKVKTINYQGVTGFYSKLKLVYSIYRLIKELKPDIVHCHLSSFNFIVVPSLLNSHPYYINTLHSLAERNIKPGIDKFLKKILYKKKIKPVTISPMCYDSFTVYMKFNTSIMINNGCRNIEKSPLFNQVCLEVNSYKRSSNTKVFINVARIFPPKNHQLLVKSFNKLIDEGYDAILLIIGSLDSYPELVNDVKKCNHTDRVYFLGTRSNVPDYLFNSDAFCLSSLWEGAPISLLEAGFAGCYPLCTPVGGCSDTIINEDWGMLSEDLSEEAYLQILKRYMERPSHDRNKISTLYKSKYSMRECANKYYNLFTHGKDSVN